MAICKCKMCGGDLNITDLDNVVVCDYCGTTQTVPSADSEKKLALFNRANRLRLNDEFDKAAGIYESIVAEFPEEAEAYWGIVLCKYGIEYVDDPATGKKIPTCHRSSFESVFEDDAFDQACENADAVARRVYREEAKQIEEIRKGILEVSSKEEPYDIFICYKETDENGDRTIDSAIAQDVYDALTEKGYRVFFSRITLEDKLGQEYEPYIFAALHSAKVMLVFGTDYEYFNAVWVKNEWSRFLQLISAGQKKVLIPCYKGIDAYDMPKEFARLQSQDMGKVGAIQDLLRGIEKLLPRSSAAAQPSAVPAQAAVDTVATVDSLLKRAFMFLEDENWQNADEYAEKVLDIEPENAEAYLIQTLAKHKYQTVSEFQNYNAGDRMNGYMTLDSTGKNTICLLKGIRTLTGCGLEEAKKICASPLPISVPFFCTMDTLAQAELILDQGDFSYSIALSSLKEDKAFQKALRYGNDVLKAELSAYLDQLDARETAFLQQTRIKKEEQIQKAIEKAEQAELKRREEAKRELEEKEKKLSWLEDYRRQIAPLNELIALGSLHIVGLKKDGTVVATGENPDGRCNVSNWRDITAIAAGECHTVGLRFDGTVVATGNNRYGQCNVSSWRDITAVATGNGHTVGLRSDGTVVAAGDNTSGQCNISQWRDIIAIAAKSYDTFGIKRDGSVVVAGNDGEGRFNVSAWRDIVAITVRDSGLIGLKKDGTVVAVGRNDQGQCEVDNWQNIVAISASGNHSLGLKKDGTVVAVGINVYAECNVSDWRDIVAVAAGFFYSLGLTKDGTIVYRGDYNHKHIFSSWQDIVAVTVGNGLNYKAVGLKKDGTVLIAGGYYQAKCNVSDWKLFDDYRTYEQERQKVAKERAEATAKERDAKNASLRKENAALESELPTLKGIFKASRRKEVEARLAEIEAELKKLGS